MLDDVRYARNGDLSIAYRVVGNGPLDIVYSSGLVSHLDLIWSYLPAVRAFDALSRLGRLITFDKPGTGLSDPVAGAPTLEQRVSDIESVLDAVGSSGAVVIGHSEAGPPSVLFTAMYPERVIALVLVSTFAVAQWKPDVPIEKPVFDSLWEDIWRGVDHWGSGELGRLVMPSLARSAMGSRLLATYERASASPGMVRALFTSAETYDVRPALAALQVPTLVLHRADEWIPKALGRLLADGIPRARYVEQPGDDHFPLLVDQVAEIGSFVTGTPSRPEPDRVLAAVVFTDIVASTEQASVLGDRVWRELLARHDQIVREELDAHGGLEVKSLGDGFLLRFERPAQAVRFGRAVCRRMSELSLAVRVGVHAGECDLVGADLAGIGVNVAARVLAEARPFEVLVSGAVRDLVLGSGLEFASRGMRRLKGLEDSWRLFAAVGDEPRGALPPQVAPVAVAQATPGSRETMSRRDRAAVQLLTRSPMWLRRAVGRMARLER